MSFDKVRAFFTFQASNEQSFLTKAENYINSVRRPTIQDNDISDFDEYLRNVPTQDLKNMKKYKPKLPKAVSLKPQLMKNCYQNIPKQFFSKQYQIDSDTLFIRNKAQIRQKTSDYQQHLDQVELCLFNQISSRFDEILSVMRTIQSLQCVVDFNKQRLKEVRGNNMQTAKLVSRKHMKIVQKIKRLERLKKVKETVNKMKLYKQFIWQNSQQIKDTSTSKHYQKIHQLKSFFPAFEKIQSVSSFKQKIVQFESLLKKSFSDKINDEIYGYLTSNIPYDEHYWTKKFANRQIFDQQETLDGTFILEQSVLIEDEENTTKTLMLNPLVEDSIVENLEKGWQDGDYSAQNLKGFIQKFCKEFFNRFFSQCRNFCFNSCLKQNRKIENPNIKNLIDIMSFSFCIKTFSYFYDIFRGMLVRCHSIVWKCLKATLQIAKEGQFTIQEKQKLVGIVTGLEEIDTFVFQTIYEKGMELIEMKIIHQAANLDDFKNIIGIFQAEEQFLEKHISKYKKFEQDVSDQSSFLYPYIIQISKNETYQLIKNQKQFKIEAYLNRTHKFILESELLESLQNEIWQSTDIPTFYYDSLHFLITGQSLNLRRTKNHTARHNMNMSNMMESSVFIDKMQKDVSLMQEQGKLSNFRIIRNQIIISQKVYKVTQTLLLLLEIIEDFLLLAQSYSSIRKSVGEKLFELLRSYNTSSNQLILFGGAVKLGKIKTKNITAKHLSLNALCIKFLLFILQCISPRIQIYEKEMLKKQMQSQYENSIMKLHSILTTKIHQNLTEINLKCSPSKGTEAIVTSTKILHDILIDFFQKDVLAKIFTKGIIKLYLNRIKGLQVKDKISAQSLKEDMDFYFNELKFLQNMIPQFSQMNNEGIQIVSKRFQELNTQQ